MPTIIRTGGGGDPLFPAGFKWKSTALGDTFPGYSDNVIPIAMNRQATKSDGYFTLGTGSQGVGDITTTQSLNGKKTTDSKVHLHYSSSNSRLSYSSVFSNAYSVFLPFLYNFDFNALKNSVKSGTPTVWLEKE